MIKWLWVKSGQSDNRRFVLMGVLGFILGFLSFWIGYNSIVNDISDVKNEVVDIKNQYDKVFNPQKVDTSNMRGIDLVELFYKSVNNLDFVTGCSLQNVMRCNILDKDQFTKWSQDKLRKRHNEYRDGVKIIGSWKPKTQYDNTGAELICIRREFYISNQDIPVQQVRQYKVMTNKDGIKTIVADNCEQQIKDGYINPTLCLVKPKMCLDSEATGEQYY